MSSKGIRAANSKAQVSLCWTIPWIEFETCATIDIHEARRGFYRQSSFYQEYAASFLQEIEAITITLILLVAFELQFSSQLTTTI